MSKEPKPMREIHQIQEKLFDKEKNLSSPQRIRKLHKETAEIIRKYGLKFKTALKV
jgi:hypothetical protein